MLRTIVALCALLAVLASVVDAVGTPILSTTTTADPTNNPMTVFIDFGAPGINGATFEASDINCFQCTVIAGPIFDSSTTVPTFTDVYKIIVQPTEGFEHTFAIILPALKVSYIDTQLNELGYLPLAGAFNYDATPPTITYTASTPSPSDTSSITVTIDFSEQANAFALSDLEDVGSTSYTASNFVVVTPGLQYTFDVTFNPADQVREPFLLLQSTLSPI